MAPAPPNPRLYLPLTVADMVKLFNDPGCEQKILINLRAELQFRIDKRVYNGQPPNPVAVALVEKVNARLTQSAANPPSLVRTRQAPRPQAPEITRSKLDFNPSTSAEDKHAVLGAADAAAEVEGDRDGHGDHDRDCEIPVPRPRESFEQFLPPDTFCRVGPIGTRPRPPVYRPELKNDVSLAIGKNDPPAMRFRLALEALIAEMKKERKGQQYFDLEDGERLPSNEGGCSYQFEFTEEGNLFEGAKIELRIEGQFVPGSITAIFQGRIIVTLREDYGESIRSCVLVIDSTALLQALHDRLDKIEKKEVTAFNVDLASRVLEDKGGQISSIPMPEWPWETQPTASQRHFVTVALSNDISWMWGPPGTGKTDTLSALTKILHDAEKRVLICSNTNQSVDQLIQKLCGYMRKMGDPALDDGRVIRLGKVGEDLEREFGAYVSPDLIVERKSEELTARKSTIESEMELLGRKVSYSQGILEKFKDLDVRRSSAAKAYQVLVQLDTKVKSAQASVSAAHAKQAEIGGEHENFKEAGVLRRMFLRSETAILADYSRQTDLVATVTAEASKAKQTFVSARSETANGAQILKDLEVELQGENRELSQKTVSEHETTRQTLWNELSEIKSQLEAIREAVLKAAKIVGATITRTFLRPTEFAAFDVVIVDEASMIMLPAVFLVAGLAMERVIVAGDFQQLPPILQTQQKEIHKILAHDIFAEAKITLKSVKARKNPRVIMLDEQFRMDPSICSIVSNLFYDGLLETGASRRAVEFESIGPIRNRLTIIDTSRIWPFTTRNAFKSKLNLMHALAIRNLVLHFEECGRLTDEGGAGRVGICTPYAGQAKLIKEILKAHDLDDQTVRASTVHSFQGDERELMVIDLVDSVGERSAGMFLQANQREDSGAKLLNVALSRAKEGIVIVANLTFLDQKLPSDALLRGVLDDVQRKGSVIDVKEVLALYPVMGDLNRLSIQPDLDSECLRTGLFSGRDFAKLCRTDMEQAKKSIVVFSGFITQDRAAQMGDLFREKIANGVKVRCITRPPNRNGSIPEEQGRAALSALEGIGVTIDLRNDIHEKVVLIDSEIAWFGSLNPLSHTSRTSELMARISNPAVASHIASILALKKRSSADANKGSGTEAENPRCGDCDDWSVLAQGKFGPFFSCARECGWTQSLNGFTRNPKSAGHRRSSGSRRS